MGGGGAAEAPSEGGHPVPLGSENRGCGATGATAGGAFQFEAGLWAGGPQAAAGGWGAAPQAGGGASGAAPHAGAGVSGVAPHAVTDAWGAAFQAPGAPSVGTESASGWSQEEAGACAAGASQELAGMSRDAGHPGPSSRGVEAGPAPSTAGAVRSWTDPPQEWQKVASSATPAPQWMQKAIDPSPFPDRHAGGDVGVSSTPTAATAARRSGPRPAPWFRGLPGGPFPPKPGRSSCLPKGPQSEAALPRPEGARRAAWPGLARSGF